MSERKIELDMNPGSRSDKKVTYSFHRPISYFINLLAKYGFAVNGMLELNSDKESQGKAARRENIARDEFPLFMVIKATKID
jgi:hypothetical protein